MVEIKEEENFDSIKHDSEDSEQEEQGNWVSGLSFKVWFFPWFGCWENARKNDVEFFNSGFIIPFVSLESKAKENERKIYTHTH